MTVIQACERAPTATPGRWQMPAGRRSIVGGSALPEALTGARDKYGERFVQGWGMTETSPLATVSLARIERKDASPDGRYRRAAMQVNSAPLLEMRLRTDDGAPTPWDGKTMGELQVHRPQAGPECHAGRAERAAAVARFRQVAVA